MKLESSFESHHHRWRIPTSTVDDTCSEISLPSLGDSVSEDNPLSLRSKFTCEVRIMVFTSSTIKKMYQDPSIMFMRLACIILPSKAFNEMEAYTGARQQFEQCSRCLLRSKTRLGQLKEIYGNPLIYTDLASFCLSVVRCKFNRPVHLRDLRRSNG